MELYNETMRIFKNELSWCNHQIKNGRNDLLELKEKLENVINELKVKINTN